MTLLTNIKFGCIILAATVNWWTLISHVCEEKVSLPKQKKDDAMKSMSPSDEKISDGQIGKINELLAAGLRKAGLQGKATQLVLEKQGDVLVEQLVGVVRGLVEGVANLVTRIVKVIRNRTPMEAIDATKREKYVNDVAVNSMPCGDGEEVEVTFFQVGRFISDDDLEKEYKKRGLKPDPRAQTAVNEVDPAFADSKPNGTHWKDENGNWVFLTFDRYFDGRRVGCNRNDNVWDGDWWFGGVRE